MRYVVKLQPGFNQQNATKLIDMLRFVGVEARMIIDGVGIYPMDIRQEKFMCACCQRFGVCCVKD